MLQNHLTARQLDNFTRRCRFTVCGEPADVFTEPAFSGSGLLFVTVNRSLVNNTAWLEGTSYTYNDPTDEISPDYMSKCKKAPEHIARSIIAQELRKWARYPADTVTGYTPAQIAAEADRIARG